MNTTTYARQWDVGSFTDPTKKPYKVSERRDGGWECSCPAWTRHMPRADCKHIDKIKRLLNTVPNSPIFGTMPQPTTQPSNQPPNQPSNQPANITFDGYTIRRRPLDDLLTGADTAPATTRSRRTI